jgi:cytochrome c5
MITWWMACTREDPEPPGDPELLVGTIEIAAEPQREGDPERGYDTLVNGDFVSCGLPRSVYDELIGDVPEAYRLPGREPGAEGLHYALNLVTTSSGIEVVGSNCFTCHASSVLGELTVGLGDVAADFTIDPTFYVQAAGLLVPAEDEAARAEWERWAERVTTVTPYTMTDTVGVNSADNLAAVLFAHRDQETLAWSSEPLMPLPEPDPVPTDVPPWWHMQKKNAMFYSGAGRGDHARIMMSASALCTDDVQEARAIDETFPDVRAYLRSLTPPPWPYDRDEALAEQGHEVFLAHCSACHGTYGETETYPNLLVPLDTIGTDPRLAAESGQLADRYVDWFNGSFYGEIARLEPQEGYVAPPLDGIWATAPYLHNASVPTLAALLDPDLRPTYWTRSSDYDPEQVGWLYTEHDHGKDQEASPSIYDTTRPGYANSGHPFGATLTEEQRTAVLEYLKTL